MNDNSHREINFLETVALEEDDLVILDQNLLPSREKYVRLDTIKDVWKAIRSLQVRGAPAIGIVAALGIYVHMKSVVDKDPHKIATRFYEGLKYLAASRPTAVNLFWALERMKRAFLPGESYDVILDALRDEAVLIKREDIQVCKSIGIHGAALLSPGMGILTHCNAGSLAASKYGTALAPVYVAHESGMNLRVYADETRPVLQGARLTAYELHRAGIDVTLICDNMAAAVMSKRLVDIVFVGCDRVAANGDAANKIGTLGLAVLAGHFGIPFYVCAPFSTIDLNTATGDDIEIEERDSNEITDLWYKEKMAPDGVKAFNPAFDVTPAGFVTGYVTEKGILSLPFANGYL